MVDRPFENQRPVGPLLDLNLDREMGQKVQLGVSGTAMPNIRKSPLNILFILDNHVSTLPADLGRGGTGGTTTLPDKIRDKLDGNPRIKAKRSGPSSAAPFEEQAVIVTLSKDSLPVQDPQIHRIEQTIENHYSDSVIDVGVKGIIIDTE